MTANEQLQSNYKGTLASQKYFTPQELTNLGKIGKRPPSGRPSGKPAMVTKDLKKAEAPAM